MSLNQQTTEAGADVRFGLAYERLRQEDEERSDLLRKQCSLPDEDESDAAPKTPAGPPCACGCGRPVPPKGRVGAPPKYATDECREKVWYRFRSHGQRGQR